MPMIDVYAAAGTFADAHALARDLASELMTIEGVPDIPMFRKNTAAFVHELPSSGLSNVDGDSTYVRVQVLTNSGALDRHELARQIPGQGMSVGEGPCGSVDVAHGHRVSVPFRSQQSGGRTQAARRPPRSG